MADTGPTTSTPTRPLARKDFVSNQDVRWCPGCGDYSILAQTQKVLATVGIPREKVVFVSGIGCSSRFPYYMNTYGFHSIHGRAPTVATGIKCANPDLQVWVVTGDGDGLSIGGNHLLHTMRRNVGVKILLFNNRIYGLTKGQYSPTSEKGKKTKSTPWGTIENPIHPVRIALAAESTFVARAIDRDPAHLATVLERAARHEGTAFVEIYQNCVIFNDGAFDSVTARAERSERLVYLEHGKPLRFGKDGNKGIRVLGTRPEIVTIGENGVTEGDLLVHDERSPDGSLAYLLSTLEQPDFPVPVGVFRATEDETYEGLLVDQIQAAVAREGPGDIQALIRGHATWTIGKDASV